MTTRPLTTSDVARYCHVSRFTVSKWIRKGKLEAYQTPGGHYRVPLSDFRAFLKRYRMPIDDDLFVTVPGDTRVVVMTDDGEVIRFIKRTLSRDSVPFRVALAGHEYGTGCQVMAFRPDLVIVDLDTSSISSSVCQRIKDGPASGHIKVLAITGERAPGDLRRIQNAGADAILSKPLDRQTLLEKVHGLLGMDAQRSDGRRLSSGQSAEGR